MNCLDLVQPLRRHLRQFIIESDTDSKLTGYIADGVKALSYRWARNYTITNPSENTYIVIPDITSSDEHTIILAASIIYKGSLLMGNFNDEGFAFSMPSAGAGSAIQRDIDELKLMLPPVRLAVPSTAPLYGFENIFNREGYNFLGYVLG